MKEKETKYIERVVSEVGNTRFMYSDKYVSHL
jgi:hypothetical protein